MSLRTTELTVSEGNERIGSDTGPLIPTCINGCGECSPVLIDFEYSREETLDGQLIESKTEQRTVSHCCHAEIEMWDEEKQEFVSDNNEGEQRSDEGE